MLLVGVMTVTFFIDFGISPPSASDVAEGFAFTAEPYATVPALGLIGAVIMPHNLYLHSALVLSRLVDRSNTRKLWEVSCFFFNVDKCCITEDHSSKIGTNIVSKNR